MRTKTSKLYLRHMFRDSLSVIGLYCLVYFLLYDLSQAHKTKNIYSVPMPLLARLNRNLDPTSPITQIPKGNQNDTVTQERLQISKHKYLIPSN